MSRSRTRACHPRRPHGTAGRNDLVGTGAALVPPGWPHPHAAPLWPLCGTAKPPAPLTTGPLTTGPPDHWNLCLSVEKLIIYDAQETLSLSPPLVGLVVAAGGVGGLGGALGAAPLARWAGEMRLVLLAIAAAGASVACMCLASSAVTLAAANLGYGAALVVASLVNRTQRQRLVPRELLGRVTSTVRVLFLAVDPLGVVAAGAATVALGGDPRPVFLVAGVTVMVAAAGGWAAGLRTAGGHPVRGSPASITRERNGPPPAA